MPFVGGLDAEDERHGEQAEAADEADAADPADPADDVVDVPLWALVGARSGDKGGDANVGLWADDDEVAAWLQRELSVTTFRTSCPRSSRMRSAGTRWRTCER